MSQYVLKVTQQYKKPVESVFATLSNHNKLSKVLGIPVKRVVDGRGDVNGVGSVRSMGLWPVTVEETVIAVTHNQSIDYRISKGGAPLKNHSGNITFRSTGTGSEVTWTIAFDSSVPVVGGIVKQVLQQGLKMGLKRV